MSMSLTLYLHPLSSFCQKVLIALYENAIPFESEVIDLGNPAVREAYRKVWPFAQFPVLRDAARARTIPESTMIIEYLAHHHAGAVKLVPEDPEQAWQVRATDRFYDLHLHEPMQKVVLDRLRPADGHDPIGVEAAKQEIRTALEIANTQLASRGWAAGDQFSMADCAAGPPLFFTNIMLPLANEYPHVSAYLDRLLKRPSYARALTEAQPYLSMFPGRW
jgi:glutathione S-transferase